MYEIWYLHYKFDIKLQKEMEIRNALQKIENYLTVVSNLNRTILAEGTMSKDELLLMKKYLYASIDRVEDIERLLIIDNNDEKSFMPTEVTENKKMMQPVVKEIVEVQDKHPENELSENIEVNVEETQDDVVFQEEESKKTEIVGEIKSEIDTPTVETKMEIAPLIEHTLPVVEDADKEEEQVNLIADKKVDLIVEETNTFANSIITEDYSLNDSFQSANEKQDEKVNETTTKVENIITEDYSLNDKKEDETPTIQKEEIKEEENQNPILGVHTEPTFVDKLVDNTRTLTDNLVDNTSNTFADIFQKNKEQEKSLLDSLDEKLSEKSQPKLFDDEHVENNNLIGNVQNKLDNNTSTSTYEEHDNVLVAEEEQEQVVYSSVKTEITSTTVADIVAKTSAKSISDNITLNDKFIFVRELFGNQFSEYESALKQLDAYENFNQAERYCNNVLWNKFNWTSRGAAAARFMDILKNKFN
ncbi:MAG: hypothetical protein R2739_06320 [Chitinophagales bacterium]